MGFKFYKKFDINRALQIEHWARSFILQGKSFNSFQRFAMLKGLSYRRAEMLEDWHRMSAIARARSIEGEIKAKRWFDSYVQEIRRQMKLPLSKAIKIAKEIQQKAIEAEPMTGEEEKYYDIYESLF